MSADQKDLNFKTDLGQKAIVEHHSIPVDDNTAQLREVLADIAADLQRTEKVPKELTYVASFTVHVYRGSLNNFAFAGLTNGMERCPRQLADAAMMKLAQDVREYYAGGRQKLRSGF